MLNIGGYNRVDIYRVTDFGVYLTDGEDEVLLPRKYVPEGAQEGDTVDVFVYTDSEDRPVATTLRPKAVAGSFAVLEVIDTNRIGAFLDWGLEKDLLAPFKEQGERMVAGRKYLVKVMLDERSGRVIASSRLTRFTKPCPQSKFKTGEKVELLIGNEKNDGFSVIVNDEFLGMIYKNQLFRPVSSGNKMTGFVARIREDGRIDVMQRRPGFGAVKGIKPLILEKLAAAGGSLPVGAKTPPAEIEKLFGVSKKVFKQALGGLYKDRKIILTPTGITLSESK